MSQTPGQIVTWNTANLTFNGMVSVATAMNQAPTNIVGLIVGNNLQISWPSDYAGWILEGQTNPISSGLSSNWGNVPGSTATNRVFIPINPANGSCFFRLRTP